MYQHFACNITNVTNLFYCWSCNSVELISTSIFVNGDDNDTRLVLVLRAHTWRSWRNVYNVIIHYEIKIITKFLFTWPSAQFHTGRLAEKVLWDIGAIYLLFTLQFCITLLTPVEVNNKQAIKRGINSAFIQNIKSYSISAFLLRRLELQTKPIKQLSIPPRSQKNGWWITLELYLRLFPCRYSIYPPDGTFLATTAAWKPRYLMEMRKKLIDYDCFKLDTICVWSGTNKGHRTIYRHRFANNRINRSRILMATLFPTTLLWDEVVHYFV